jgi:hypothetical protein
VTTTLPPQAQRAQALRHAAVRATLAPSVHNTQPWRFVVGYDTLEIYADWNRKLRVLDPTGRELLISCGCALFNARVALAGRGYDAMVERFSQAASADLLARLRVPDEPVEWLPLGPLDGVIELRHSNRRRFADDPVPPELMHTLVGAATAEDAIVFPVTRQTHRLATARLSREADHEEITDPGYRAELRAWTTQDPQRRDGVPWMAVPHVDAGSDDDVPMRDFDTHGMGWLPADTHSTMDQCLLLLGTVHDEPAAWLRAGEALEHVLLEITRWGYAASLLTQVIEIPSTRSRLRNELGLDMNPHVLLRVGRAPKTPASPRRRLEDVVSGIE